MVLITERYAESVLLMRKKLCMNLLDLFQPPTKVHSHDEFEFSDKQKMNFYEFQKLDLHMYNVRISHFSSGKMLFSLIRDWHTFGVQILFCMYVSQRLT